MGRGVALLAALSAGRILLPGAAGAAGADGADFAARAEEMRRQALAAGDQPYGAVVVRDGQVVGLGPSRVVTAGDPTAHAEMEAIRDAARRLATRDLSGCALYSTSPPCRMCETAAYWAGIDGLFHGGSGGTGVPPRYDSC
jgi:tRNA(Arg) A34 adenosine deaminase TadA